MSVIRGVPPSARWTRIAERVVLAILFGGMLIWLYLIAGDWNFGDINAYWLAAMRLREGALLYPTHLNPDSYEVFRYAPWFAWIWVPLTYLPRTLVDWGWAAILGLASGAILVAVVRLRTPAAWAFAFIITPWLLSLVQVGNIQPLVVAALAFGISRRSGPIWLAIAGSLKAVPLVFALVYVARRQWLRLALTLAITIVLLAPFLLYDLSGYQTDPGRSVSFYYYVSPLAWAATAAAALLAATVLAIRRSPFVWAASAVAVMLLAPRTHVTYATYLVVAILNGGHDPLLGRVRNR
ncbi:MAG: glycosyltransferase 87 family protein [Chloroflexota bacterium]